MAVKASVTITISKYRDTDSITRYYKLQASTAAAPAVPTTLTPSGWSTSEPTYTSGSTNTLYYTDCYQFSDGTFQYTDDGNGKAVKSSSYEAAKEAYNKAQAAQNTANELSNKLVAKDIIVGTQTTSTRFWTGDSQLESLQDGDEILYWLPYADKAEAASSDKIVGVDMRVNSTTTKTAGTLISSFESSSSSAAWINLTLKDGSTKTGWIPLYYSGSTRMTTHYSAGNCIRLVYRVNANVNGVQYTGFFGDANYVGDNTYDRIRFNNTIKAKTAISASRFIVADESGFFHLLAGIVFDIDKPILWANAAIAANATGTDNYIAKQSCTVRNNTSSSWTATQYQTLYLVGILNGNKFTVDSTTPFTTTKPTTDDNKYYISLGYMYSTYQVYLYPEHPIFKYINGQFKNISQIAYEAQENLDNLDIGSRNYVLDSARERIITLPSSKYNTVRIEISPVVRELDPNYKTFIFSCDAYYEYDEDEEPSHGVYIQLYFRNSESSNKFNLINTQEITRSWTRVYCIGSFKDDTTVQDAAFMYFRAIGDIEGIKIHAKNFKAEKGNKNTDWTPAPEDYDDTITSVVNLYYASNSSTPPTKPNAHVGTNSASSYNQWNIALPTYNENYPYLYTCKETLNKGGTYNWTTVEQTTYAQATKEMQDDIAGIQADYVSNTSFVEYQRTQNATNAGVSEKLLRTEVTLYGDFVYDLLTEEPEDWSTNYKKYYIKSGDNYITVSGSSAPTWQANTYYELITDLTDPNSLVNKMQKVDNDINGENGALDRISDAESTLENTGLNEYNSSIKINQRFLDIEDTVDQMKRVFNITGGVNLIQNSVGYFMGTDNKPTMWSIASGTIYSPFGYDADLVGITLSRGKLFCAKGSLTSLDNNIVGLIPNKFLSISFKYKNGTNATSKVKIYSGNVVYFEKTFSSAVNQWTEYTYNADTDPAIANPTFACTSNALKIEISSTNNTDNNGFEISDLMLNYGDPKAWELYNSEVFGAIFRLSSLGIELTATTAKTKNFMTTDGILVYEYTPDPTAPSDPNKGIIGNLITKITDDGTLTNKLESTGDIIERNLIHTMITVNNKNIYVEYIR